MWILFRVPLGWERPPMQLNGDISPPKDRHELYAPVENAMARWSVRRMMLVVFAICLVTWIVVIASVFGL
jgi:hypothetical protein